MPQIIRLKKLTIPFALQISALCPLFRSGRGQGEGLIKPKFDVRTL